MEPEEIDELIERYLKDKLSPSERQDFEYQLIKHPDWKEKLKLNQSLLTALDPLKTSFRAKLNEINKNNPPLKKNSFTILSMQPWMVAAGILLLISTGMILILNNSKFNPEKLYKEYMIAPGSLSPELFLIRGNEEIFNPSLSDSILRIVDIKYIDGKLQEAMDILRANRDNVKSDKMTFQLGLLELLRNNPHEAINYFDQAKYDPDEIAWYKALSYLKLNNTADCLKELNKIRPTSRWSENSKTLASKLN